jgi:predicted metal-dependent phosphoesterase TrpH
MLQIEFHCHTVYSKDSLLEPEQLIKAARKKRLDRLVITDHNTIMGAIEAKKIAPDFVIVGEEIMTQDGELLAAFVQEEIPPRLSPHEAIKSLREQGAFISVSHPFDLLRSGHWELPALLEIVPFIDAIEVFNSRCMSARYNQQAKNFANQHNLIGTVGSDAHTAFEVGRARLVLPEFEDAETLKVALRDAQFITWLSSPFVHFTSRYAVWYKKATRPIQS